MRYSVGEIATRYTFLILGGFGFIMLLMAINPKTVMVNQLGGRNFIIVLTPMDAVETTAQGAFYPPPTEISATALPFIERKFIPERSRTAEMVIAEAKENGALDHVLEQVSSLPLTIPISNDVVFYDGFDSPPLTHDWKISDNRYLLGQGQIEPGEDLSLQLALEQMPLENRTLHLNFLNVQFTRSCGGTVEVGTINGFSYKGSATIGVHNWTSSYRLQNKSNMSSEVEIPEGLCPTVTLQHHADQAKVIILVDDQLVQVVESVEPEQLQGDLMITLSNGARLGSVTIFENAP